METPADRASRSRLRDAGRDAGNGGAGRDFAGRGECSALGCVNIQPSQTLGSRLVKWLINSESPFFSLHYTVFLEMAFLNLGNKRGLQEEEQVNPNERCCHTVTTQLPP